MRREEPQLEPDPALGQQRKTFIGRVGYTEPKPHHPQPPKPKTSKPKKQWTNVLDENELTQKPWQETLNVFDNMLDQWQTHHQQRQTPQYQFDWNNRVTDNKMSYEQQSRSPYDITISPLQMHRQNLISPVFAPQLLSDHFLNGVQEQANEMSPRTLASSFRDLKVHAGQTTQRLMDLMKEGASQAKDEYFNKLQRQYNKEAQEAERKSKYYWGHPERFGEMMADVTQQAIGKTIRNQVMMRAEIGNALLFDSLDTNGINQWTSEQLGLDPNDLEMQMTRPFAYGAGTVGSLAIPVGGFLKGAHLGHKATKGFHLAARAGQAYNHIPKPAQKFLKEVSLAGLQGFIANPNIDNPDKNDFLNWDARVQSAMAAMLLTGGGHAIGKVRELLGSKGRKIFNSTDFKADPFHTGDAEKTLSSSMGFAGGKGKRRSLRGENDNLTGPILDARFKQPSILPTHLELTERPIDLPGNGSELLSPPYPREHFGKSWTVNVNKKVINEGEYTEMAPSYIREGLTSEGQHFVYSQKIVQQIKERAWDLHQIQNLLDYGKQIEGAVDRRFVNNHFSQFKTYQGTAVKFIDKDGYSITFNDATREIIQVDNRKRPPKF